MKDLKKVNPSFRMERKKRLLKRKDFLFIQKRGHRSFGKLAVIIGHQNRDLPNGRLGITVPKKIGPAHERNLIKRRIRHIVRLYQDIFLKQDLVIIAREATILAGFLDLKEDLLSSISRLTKKF